MKKLVVLLITVFTAIGINAFAQDGYVAFQAPGHNIYDVSSSGVGVPAPGDVSVTFLWALTGIADPLGAGVPTNGLNYVVDDYGTIESMISSDWIIAHDASNGGVEADVAVGSTGVVRGDFAYDSGTSFQLAETTAGDTYEFIVIGWDNQFGATTLEEALTEGVPIGWSSEFDYATGASSISADENFIESGEAPFGVDSMPEPTSLALAGLGGLSMLLVRRRKR
jgi:hypothetical protein